MAKFYSELSKPFHDESQAWKRMLVTVEALGKDKFSQILSEYAGHKHEESCVMQNQVECGTFTNCGKGSCEDCHFAMNDMKPEECQTMQELAEKWHKTWTQIQEMTSSYGVTAEVERFRMAEREIEEGAWNIVPRGSYYDIEAMLEGKVHGHEYEIKGKETRTRMVGRGQKRHEETYEVDTIIGREARFDKDAYAKDDGWGFIRESEKRLVPSDITLRLRFEGKHIHGHKLLTVAIGNNGEWEGNWRTGSEIQGLVMEPFVANTFNVDPKAVMEKARMLAIGHEVQNGNEEPTTPEDSELEEDGYVERAQEIITSAHEEPEVQQPEPEKPEAPEALEVAEPSVEPKTEPAWPYVCRKCDESFPTRGTRRTHMAALHSRDRTVEKPAVPTVELGHEPVMANVEEPKPLAKVEFDMPSTDISWNVDLSQPTVKKLEDTPQESPQVVHVDYPFQECERCGYKTRIEDDIYCLRCGKRYGWIALDDEPVTPQPIRAPVKATPTLMYLAALLVFQLGFTARKHLNSLIAKATQESVRLISNFGHTVTKPQAN